jgi:hypothetical protein
MLALLFAFDFVVGGCNGSSSTMSTPAVLYFLEKCNMLVFACTPAGPSVASASNVLPWFMSDN